MESQIENLVDDALLIIFSYLSPVELDTVACVCQSWRRLVSEMRAREPSLQIHVFAPSVSQLKSWSPDELVFEMRRGVRRMITRPLFGVYFMTIPFMKFINERLEHPLKNPIRTGNDEIDELIQAISEQNIRCRLTPADCLFVITFEVLASDGRERLDCDENPHTRPNWGLGALMLPQAQPQAYRVCTIQMDSFFTLYKNEQELFTLLGLDADERLRFLLVLIDIEDLKKYHKKYKDSVDSIDSDDSDSYFTDSDDDEIPDERHSFNFLDNIRHTAIDHPNDARNFAVTFGIAQRAICMKGDKFISTDRVHRCTMMALIERRPGCVRVAQVRVNKSENVCEKVNELSKTGILRDVESSNQSYFALKLTDYELFNNREHYYEDKKLLEQAMGVKSMPMIGLISLGLGADEYLPDYTGQSEKSATTHVATEKTIDKNIIEVFTIIQLNK